MKGVAILLLAAIAMASAQVNKGDQNPGPGQVKVVDRPGGSAKVVGQLQDVDSAFSRPSIGGNNVVISNPDPAFYQPGNGNVENPDQGFYLPSNNDNANNSPNGDNIIPNPDQGFYLSPDPNAQQNGETVVSNPDQGFNLDLPNPDQGFYVDPNAQQNGETVIPNPDQGFYVDPNSQQNEDTAIPNPDESFYLPSDPQVDSAYYRPPVYSTATRPPRPNKYPNEFARGGK